MTKLNMFGGQAEIKPLSTSTIKLKAYIAIIDENERVIDWLWLKLELVDQANFDYLKMEFNNLRERFNKILDDMEAGRA